MSDSHIEDLLAEYWSRREAGEDVSPSTFVAEHSEHALALRPALMAMMTAATLLPAAEQPATIGGYRVQGRLGRGSTGEVFAVVDANERPLALKRLLPHVGAVVRAQQRLQREAVVLRALQHEAIVEVVDVGEDAAAGDVPFVVMERIEGGTLAAVIDAARNRGRDAAYAVLAGPGDCWQRVARCVATLARAMAAAHAVGVLHRDLKPGNVLLRADGTPVIVDFGLASDAAAATLTGTGDVLGTPHYMSPEQARGDTAVATSDVYGLGAILFELLTLVPPRQGTDPLQVLAMACSTVPPPPRVCDRAVPRELDLITRRAMAFRAKHRYASAAELGSALSLVVAGGRPIGLTLGLSQRTYEFWRRRRGVLVAAAVALFLIGFGWFALDMRSAARAERMRSAVIAAAENHFDEDREGLVAAAAVLADDDDEGLVAWMLAGEGAASTEPFVQALATGRAALTRDAKAAVVAFTRASELRPESPVAAAWLGIAALRAKDLVLAERELTSAVRSLPGSVRLRTDLARVLRQVDKPAVALAQMRHAVTLPRASAETWHELAKACTSAKDQEAALAAIDEAIARNGGATTYMLRTKAVVLGSMKRYAEAEPLLRDIVERAPTENSWTSYGATLDRLHRLREAADAYRAALRCDTRHAPALLNLVFLYAGSDRAECTECRAYFEHNPDMLDPARVDEYATALLAAEEGSFDSVVAAASFVRSAGGGGRFAAGIEQRLATDLPAEALGRLLRAQKVLRGP